jgi:serine/threonine protein kinase
MPVSPSCAEFLECLEKSKLLEKPRLDAFLHGLQENNASPESPRALAVLMIKRGLLTPFQAEQLLQGKYRNFFIRDKYRVMERLGSGGNGIVFLCEHTVMRRLVAIKVLPSSLANDQGIIERFRREARAAAQLKHPNIVTAHDVDQVGKMHFLVLEHIDGHNLHHIIKSRGAFSPERAAHYIRQAAEGLQHAHELGLVHRDIKPGNMLLDRSGTIKILDMGLARFFREEDNLTRQQEAGAILGTADFLAPEQALDSHAADIRCDIYSLGITFYFLLAGSSPFEEGTTAQKLIWHQMRQPKPIRDVRPEVPEEMAAVLDRMIAKDPEQRYQEPAEVSAALAPWTSEPIPPPPEEEMPNHTPAIRALCQPETSQRTTSFSFRAALASSQSGSGAHSPAPMLQPASGERGKKALEALADLTDETQEEARPVSAIDTPRTMMREKTPPITRASGIRRTKPDKPISHVPKSKKKAVKSGPPPWLIGVISTGVALVLVGVIVAVWLLASRRTNFAAAPLTAPEDRQVKIMVRRSDGTLEEQGSKPPLAGGGPHIFPRPTQANPGPTEGPRPGPDKPPLPSAPGGSGLPLASRPVGGPDKPPIGTKPAGPVDPPHLPPPPPGPPPVVKVDSPLEHQVFQRQSKSKGKILVRGEAPAGSDRVEVRFLGKSVSGDLPATWQQVNFAQGGEPRPGMGPGGGPGQPRRFEGIVETMAGGWYAVELRAIKGDKELATKKVDHVGVGEVFIVAGQANASNLGAARMRPATDLVVAFAGDHWQFAEDPQPGVLDGSTGGSMWPVFGDALIVRWHVPIGICSVAKSGSTFDHWKPDGEAYKVLVERMKHFNKNGGFRAVLWYQDELDPKITATTYANQMVATIVGTQQAVGARCLWFIAEASTGADGKQNKHLLEGQRMLCAKTYAPDKFVYRGPDTDSLQSEHRTLDGSMHFSAKGLQEAGGRWAATVGALLEKSVHD